MAVKKQPEANPDGLSEAADDWFRSFLKHVELHLADTARDLPAAATSTDFGIATIHAVLRTLLDAGVPRDQALTLFGTVWLESGNMPLTTEWTAELNKRRFALIDREIQETITPSEHIELAGLTELMRQSADAEENVPFEGARKLHHLLQNTKPAPPDSAP